MSLRCISMQKIYSLQSQPRFIFGSSLLLPSCIFLYRTLLFSSKRRLIKYDAVSLLSVAFLMPPTYLVSFFVQMNEILTQPCTLALATLFPSPSHLCMTLFFFLKFHCGPFLTIKQFWSFPSSKYFSISIPSLSSYPPITNSFLRCISNFISNSTECVITYKLVSEVLPQTLSRLAPALRIHLKPLSPSFLMMVGQKEKKGKDMLVYLVILNTYFVFSWLGTD